MNTKPKRTKRRAPDSPRSLSAQLRAILAGRPELVQTIADRAGVAHSLLSRFRRGERGLTLATADRLAEVLGLRLVEAGGRRRRNGTVEIESAIVEAPQPGA